MWRTAPFFILFRLYHTIRPIATFLQTTSPPPCWFASLCRAHLRAESGCTFPPPPQTVARIFPLRKPLMPPSPKRKRRGCQSTRSFISIVILRSFAERKAADEEPFDSSSSVPFVAGVNSPKKSTERLPCNGCIDCFLKRNVVYLKSERKLQDCYGFHCRGMGMIRAVLTAIQ